jgi:hypothetical protein
MLTTSSTTGTNVTEGTRSRPQTLVRNSAEPTTPSGRPTGRPHPRQATREGVVRVRQPWGCGTRRPARSNRCRRRLRSRRPGSVRPARPSPWTRGCHNNGRRHRESPRCLRTNHSVARRLPTLDAFQSGDEVPGVDLHRRCESCDGSHNFQRLSGQRAAGLAGEVRPEARHLNHCRCRHTVGLRGRGRCATRRPTTRRFRRRSGVRSAVPTPRPLRPCRRPR